MQALPEKGRKLRPLQTPKAERDLAVASVLARDRFVRALAAMGEKWGFEFPKGSALIGVASAASLREFEAQPLQSSWTPHLSGAIKIKS